MNAMSPNFRRSAGCALLLAGALMLGTAGAATPNPADGAVTQSPVSFVTGGVGEGERSRLDEISHDYNLRVVTARANGEYLAGVSMVIRDGKGAQVLATVTQGPWLLAQLPPGEYSVLAADGNQIKKQRVSVNRERQAVVVMYLADT